MRGYERAEKIVWHDRTFGRYCSISGSIVPLRAIRISEGTLLQVDKWSTKSLNAEMSFCNARLYLTRQTLYKRPSGWGTACTELCKSLIRPPPAPPLYPMYLSHFHAACSHRPSLCRCRPSGAAAYPPPRGNPDWKAAPHAATVRPWQDAVKGTLVKISYRFFGYHFLFLFCPPSQSVQEANS